LKNFVVQAAQKDLSGKAREKIGDHRRTLIQYVGASQLSATKDMSLFQQPS
jgi:hypothetical protein